MDELKRYATSTDNEATEGIAAKVAAEIAADNASVEIDLTPFNPAQPLHLTWQRPDIANLYQIAVDAGTLKRKNILWPDGLVLDIAMMAQCHVTPRTETPAGVFYSMLAGRNDAAGRRVWMYLTARLRQEFPDVVAFTTGQGDLTRIVLPLSVSVSDTSADTP